MRRFLLIGMGVFAGLLVAAAAATAAVSFRLSTLTVAGQIDKVERYATDRCPAQSALLGSDVYDGFYIKNFFGVVNASLSDEERLVYGPFWTAYREAVRMDEVFQDPITLSFFWTENYRLFDLSARIFLSSLVDFPFQVDSLVLRDAEGYASVENAASSKAASDATDILLGDAVEGEVDEEKLLARAAVALEFARMLGQPNAGMAEAFATLPERTYAEQVFGIAVKFDMLKCVVASADYPHEKWDDTLVSAIYLANQHAFARIEAALSVLEKLGVESSEEAKNVANDVFVAELRIAMSEFEAISDEETDHFINVQRLVNKGLRG